jgi:hypothetical protein
MEEMRMKKRIGLLCAVLISLTVFVLSGCGSSPVITNSELTEEESALAAALTDVSARFTLPTNGTCTVTLTTYHSGKKKSQSEMRTVTAVEGNDKLYISGMNSSGIDYVWTITAPGGRLTYPTPYFTVKSNQSMIRITDIGESEFSIDDNKEHLLYYVAYISGDDSSTISEKPFHQWCDLSESDQQDILKQFDCVYLITVSQQTETNESDAT